MIYYGCYIKKALRFIKTNMNIIKIVALPVAVITLWSCEMTVPDKDRVEAWQKNKATLIRGYTGFQGHWVNSDIVSRIWSYICPPDLTPEDAFDILESQISDFEVHHESDSLLSLRRPSSNSGSGAFTELRFLYDFPTGVMTILLAYKNPGNPERFYGRLIALQERYHLRRVLPRKLVLMSE